jgi:hypothetical protein
MSSGSNEGGPAPSNMGGSNYGAAPGSNRAGIEGTSPRMAHDTGTSMGGMPNPQMGRTRRANTEWFISQFDELRQSLAAMHAMVAKGKLACRHTSASFAHPNIQCPMFSHTITTRNQLPGYCNPTRAS